MDEQRLWRNEDVENERRGNDGDSFQLMRENKREREREKRWQPRPRALLIKLSTRLSTPIRLPCFEPCRRVIPTNFGYGHCTNRRTLNAQTWPNLPSRRRWLPFRSISNFIPRFERRFVLRG